MKIVSLADIPHEGVSHNPEIRKQVLLRKGDLPHLTNFSRSTLLTGQSVKAHQHSQMYEIFFVASGTGIVRVEDEERRIAAGVCIMVEPGERHEIINDDTEELVLCYFGIEI